MLLFSCIGFKLFRNKETFLFAIEIHSLILQESDHAIMLMQKHYTNAQQIFFETYPLYIES